MAPWPRRTWLFGGRRRRHSGDSTRTAILQFRLDVFGDLFCGQSVLAAKTMQTLFLLGREDAVGQGERKIFVKLNDRLLVRLGGQFRINLAPAFGIEQFNARLGEVT